MPAKNIFSKIKSKLKTNSGQFHQDEDENSDEVGSHLSKHGMESTKDRYVTTTTRVAIGALGVSLAVNCVLSIAVIQMLPLYKVVPYFVTFSDKADQVVTIYPPKADTGSIPVLAENNVRQYITQRHTISNDPQETLNRWNGPIRSMSTNDVYQDFLSETKPIYEDMVQKKFNRDIVIRSVNQTVPGFYRIEFDAIDRRIGAGLTDGGQTTRTFIAEMRYALQPKTVPYADRFINPIGFTVLNYSVRPKEN